MNRSSASVLVLFALLLAGCTSTTSPGSSTASPSATSPAPGNGAPGGGDTFTQASVSNGNGAGGGSVKDVAPTVPAFVVTTASVDNSGGNNLTFNGSVFDANGEQDLQFLFVKGTTFNATNGVQTLGTNHTITGAERNQTSEPSSFASDGYKVWDCGGRDGVLCWKYNLPVPQFAQAGLYTFNVTTGKASSFGQSLVSQQLTATVTSFSQIDFAPFPVDASGNVLTGANWGGWNANPGDASVPSTNYLKLTNNGDVPNAKVQISFSGTAFTGTTDGSYTVPFAGNVQFQSCDAAAGTAPSACTFSGWSAPNAGATTVTFQGKGHVLYVQYRVVSLPSVLMAQSYGATFTATEL
jgi:hypothetical protein